MLLEVKMKTNYFYQGQLQFRSFYGPIEVNIKIELF